MMLSAVFLLVAVRAENPVTEVVTLLQEMLEKSKADGVSDREGYAKFKCYCDTNTEEKTKAIANATAEIELMEATLADRRAQNEKLSQEVFELKKAMDDNEAAREEATNIREKEKVDFEKEEADLVTGLSQLERAIKLLQAVGADQTQSQGADYEQAMAADATAAAKEHLAGGFLVRKAQLSKLSSDMKSALRAASVFLSSAQRKTMTSFLSMDAPGNYNAQSGEIVGILKSMNDTFVANLANARAVEAKAQTDYDEFMELKKKEFDEMEQSSNDKKEVIGNNAAEIATTESEKDTKEGERSDNQEFLAALSARCEAKKTEFDRRNNLRSQEEAAIAQAIAILNSDSSFDAFAKADSTSGGGSPVKGGPMFAQLSVVHSSTGRAARVSAIKRLLAAARETKSLRLARAVSMLAANNPFEKVLAKIRDIISLIDKEEEADVNKKAWCEAEQSENEANKKDKESDMGTLQVNIDNLEIAVKESKTNIEQATEDLGSNRESQAAETSTRKDSHALFQSTLSNAQDAERILDKAIEVLKTYYDFLKRADGPHTYTTHTGKDSGGSNLERLAGKSVEELEEACSANPACVGFNTAGWLKSALAPEAEWYDWDGGDLVVKVFDEAFLQGKAPEEVEAGPEYSSGQGETGAKVLEMLGFIKDECKTEADDAIDTEKSTQAQFETNMQALTAAEQGLLESISTYELDLATTEKRLEQAREDLVTTTKEHEAIVAYLAEIEPGCTFMITNYETRKGNRETEKAALEGAITTLEASPAFQNFESSQESEDLGKCSEICEGKKDTDTAACQACQEDVTIAGYCAQKSETPGCAEATATGSADAMNAPA